MANHAARADKGRAPPQRTQKYRDIIVVLSYPNARHNVTQVLDCGLAVQKLLGSAGGSIQLERKVRLGCLQLH